MRKKYFSKLLPYLLPALTTVLSRLINDRISTIKSGAAICGACGVNEKMARYCISLLADLRESLADLREELYTSHEAPNIVFLCMR